VQRGKETLGARISRIEEVVHLYYGSARFFFWGGLVLLIVLGAVALASRTRLKEVVLDPYVAVVMTTFLGIAIFSLTDFQGYPDLYPLLPYAAIGVAGATAFLERHLRGVRLQRGLVVLALLAVALVIGRSWVVYSNHKEKSLQLTAERAYGAKLNKVLGPGDTLYALGDPTPLVLTKRHNPSRYIYLGSGVALWAIDHTYHNVQGWENSIQTANPEVVTIADWNGPIRRELQAWLKATYGKGTHFGHWLLYAKPPIRARAASMGITL
jgi:hypothetical protein